MIITPSKKIDDPDADATERYHVFATNLSPARALDEIETLPEEYRRRWGIETGYKAGRAGASEDDKPQCVV